MAQRRQFAGWDGSALRAVSLDYSPRRSRTGLALGQGRNRGARSSTRALVASVAAGGLAFGLTEVLDRVGVSAAVQGGIFAGIAVGLAFVSPLAAAAVASVALYELMAAGWRWFAQRYPAKA